jgi:hypothetical protein
VLEIRTDGSARQLPGNYTDWRNTLIEERISATASKEAAKKKAKVQARKTADKAPSKKAKKPRNPWAFERLEEAILKLEAEREQLLANMQKPENYKDAGRMSDLQYRQAELERDLEQKNEEWANWS